MSSSFPSPASAPADDWQFTRRVFLVLGVVAGALAAYKLSYVLVLVFTSLLVAVLLNTITELLQRWLRLPRAVAVALAVLAFAGVLGGFGVLFAQQLYAQIRDVVELLPQAVAELGQRFGFDWEFSKDNLHEIAARLSTGTTFNRALGYGSVFASVLTDVLIVLVGAVFLVSNPGMYRRGAALLLPARSRLRFLRALRDAGNALRLWLLGQGTVMLSVGLMMWGAYTWLGLPSAVTLALIAALADFVPFLGPIVGAIPALVIAATIDTQTLLWTLGAVVVVQQIESYVLMPFVQRRAVKLPPFVGLFAIVVFGTLFGIMGIVLAVPMAVATMTLVQRLWVRDVLGTRITVVGSKKKDAPK
ncbi:MAG: AI-2E family transporter [Pseudomonadota bacterium]|nr:AI-2E family transporter [Pseudomonadota bacterium]